MCGPKTDDYSRITDENYYYYYCTNDRSCKKKKNHKKVVKKNIARNMTAAISERLIDNW